MYPDNCDWLISQKRQNNWFKMQTGCGTSNFINRYSSPGEGGGNSAEMLITLKTVKILSTLKLQKICLFSIKFVPIATLDQQQITLNERIYFVRPLSVIDKS